MKYLAAHTRKVLFMPLPQASTEHQLYDGQVIHLLLIAARSIAHHAGKPEYGGQNQGLTAGEGGTPGQGLALPSPDTQVHGKMASADWLHPAHPPVCVNCRAHPQFGVLLHLHAASCHVSRPSLSLLQGIFTAPLCFA